MNNNHKEDFRPKWFRRVEPYAKLASQVATACAFFLLLISTCKTTEQVNIMREQWNEDRRPYIFMPAMTCYVENGVINSVGRFENLGKSVASNVRINWVVKELRSGKDAGRDSSKIGYLFPGKIKSVDIFERSATKSNFALKIRIDWIWKTLNVRDSIIYDQIILNSEDVNACNCQIIDEKELHKIWGNFQL